jgi:hypothetical protein
MQLWNLLRGVQSSIPFFNHGLLILCQAQYVVLIIRLTIYCNSTIKPAKKKQVLIDLIAYPAMILGWCND